jgi:hypothetical protein
MPVRRGTMTEQWFKPFKAGDKAYYICTDCHEYEGTVVIDEVLDETYAVRFLGDNEVFVVGPNELSA